MSTASHVNRFSLPAVAEIFLRRRERVALACLAVVAGILSRVVGETSTTPLAAGFLLAAFASVPLAIAKTATACGLNSLATFAIVSRPIWVRTTDWLLYLVASSASGLVFGTLLSWVGRATNLPLIAPVSVLLIYLGLREFGFVRPTPPVASGWQVPAR